MFFKLREKTFELVLRLMMLIILTGCGSTRIIISRIEPPKYPIKGGKILAVVDFKSPPEAPDAGERIASSFVSKLAPTKYYQLMERSRMDAIFMEHKFSQTDYVDESKAIEMGKMLNAHYLITGEVTGCSVEDQKMTEQKAETRITGYYHDYQGRLIPRFETFYVDVPVLVRSGTVAAAFRMINVETSEVIVGDRYQASFQKKAFGSGEIAALPSADDLLNRLMDEVTTNLAKIIAPHKVTDSRRLEKGKTPPCKNGVNLARNGLWDEAASSWERAIALRPDDPAPYNNLGVFSEVQGDYDRAIDYYEKALRIKPDNEIYMCSINEARRLKRLFSRKMLD
ncbi:MAG TPA: DUF6340 family protein [Candidatus Sumerlaeota bacterium]|nr:DUF6340 family protein [Candidatus Sumerlaeota bacterium]HON51566.1 DUF6340 family protein [Candidatus Sumerlaeota bacterium]HOR65925.1 DUF6340 family protein [Candidatus Sumerlaeota bacterium]HQH11526.1 DUF6340 family protein [Candidatus Sumerlaeota bacterium]HRU55481.1 DUF6340 family protein [Candidatus Sumerlaeia bacterium]